MTANTLHLSAAPAQQSPRADFLRRFRRHKLAMIGIVVLIFFCFVAIFGNWIMPYDPNATNTAYAGGRPQPPSLEHPFGTDNYGRDYLSRTIAGLQISMLVGVTAVAFQLLIGVTIGAVAGISAGGWITC